MNRLRKAGVSGLTAIVLGASSLIYSGCETTDPGAGYQAGAIIAANEGPRMATSRAGLLGWALTAAFANGQADYEREKAAAENAARMQIEAQEKIARERREWEEQQRRRAEAEIKAREPRVEFDKIELNYNIMEGNQIGLIAKIDFKSHNLKDEEIQLYCYVFNADGSKKRDVDGIHRSVDGQVCFAGPTSVSPYEHAQYKECNLFIPYQQFDITEKGKTELKLSFQAYRKSTERFVEKFKSVPITMTLGE